MALPETGRVELDASESPGADLSAARTAACLARAARLGVRPQAAVRMCDQATAATSTGEATAKTH